MFLSISELRDLTVLMSGRLKIDYTGYNLSFFGRRVANVFKKMGLRRVQDLQTILNSLVKDDEVTYHMAVPGTEVFRSPSFWRQIIRILTENDIKTVWVPSLTSNHELYSLAIVRELAGRRNETKIEVNVVSDRTTREVNELLIPETEKDLTKTNYERLQTSTPLEDFIRTENENGMYLKRELMENIEFRNGWYMNTDTVSYDMVLFRNTLIEYKKSLHEKAAQKMMDSLKGRGSVLCLGGRERPLVGDGWFDETLAYDGIYIRK
ncbi:MAG: hypothetical protein II951_13425 [Bacteroidales bacterium]|nr:hypothetical protein [Bacteroidales bacterium]